MQFLMIATITPDSPKKEVVAQIRQEALAAWRLWEQEIVRSVYYKADMSGAVMIMEADSVEEIEEALDTLPMIHAGLLSTEIIPLKAYTGWGKLFAKELL